MFSWHRLGCSAAVSCVGFVPLSETGLARTEELKVGRDNFWYSQLNACCTGCLPWINSWEDTSVASLTCWRPAAGIDNAETVTVLELASNGSCGFQFASTIAVRRASTLLSLPTFFCIVFVVVLPRIDEALPVLLGFIACRRGVFGLFKPIWLLNSNCRFWPNRNMLNQKTNE